METEDEYIKHLPMQKAQQLLRSCAQDYDSFAELLMVCGNELKVISRQHG